MTRLAACFVLLASLWMPSGQASAEEPPGAAPKAAPKAAPGAAVPAGDFRLALDAIQRSIEGWREKPTAAGLYDRREETWKRYAKPRVARMVARVKQLRSASLWRRASVEGPAVAVASEGWGPLVRGVAALYTELGTIKARYGDVRLDGKYARRLWVGRNPKPDRIEPTLTEPALAEANGLIGRYLRLGQPVPYHLYRERDRLASIVDAERREAREVKRQEYEARKHEAYQAIEARVLETRGLLDADVARLSDQQRSLQALIAAGQAIEEARLRALVTEVERRGARVEDAAPLLAALAAGRAEGLAFRDARSSRYGSVLRQKWTTPRGKLLKGIDRATLADGNE